jgi:hypothetical protein
MRVCAQWTVPTCAAACEQPCGEAEAYACSLPWPPVVPSAGRPPPPEQVRSYYLDLHLVGEYWGLPINGPAPRAYHHTGMTSMW